MTTSNPLTDQNPDQNPDRNVDPNIASQNTELDTAYEIPTVIVLAAVPLIWVEPIAAGVVAILGMILFYQAATIRLVFTATDLEVYRWEEKIRTFPYQDWQDWQVFWLAFPVLFYFKEVKSIHFLPILFDVQMLKTCLKKYIPLKKS